MSEKLIQRICNKEFTLIAEIGVNYYDIARKYNVSPLEAAKRMIYEAALAGAHAVKFQVYKAELLAALDSPSYWDLTEETETSQRALFKRYDAFGRDEYVELAAYCEEVGIEFLATAFDIGAVDYLEDIVSIYKISSSDLNNVSFVEYQAKKNKPIMLSIGASDEKEIRKAVNIIKKYNDKPIVLMHCVLEYPTPANHANLRKIVSLQEEFSNCIIGYSDHVKPENNYEVLKTAYIIGAHVIEKHFTLDKTLKGNDHYHAMDAKDIGQIISSINTVENIMGNGDLICIDTEKTARINARRSIVSTREITMGQVISEDDITYKRPGTGISASDFYQVIGKKAKCDISEDAILQWDMLY